MQQNLRYIVWPVAVILIALIAMLVFREPISRFLDRAQTISTSGIETASLSQDSSQGMEVEKITSQWIPSFDSSLMSAQEDVIRADLKKTNITSPADQAVVLTRVLAGMELSLAYQKRYTEILGSQLTLLSFMDSLGPVPMQIVRKTYDDAAAKNPATYKDSTFDSWIGYLQKAGMLTQTGEQFSITTNGREFLKYLSNQGYTTAKPE